MDSFLRIKFLICLYPNGASGVLIYFCFAVLCVLCLKLDKFALNKNAFGFNWLVEFGDSIRFFALFG
jgi:hypothetical protein